jgi:hypothetical protein
VHRLYPDQFDKDVPNPWAGVTKKRRTMATKKAATREQVYDFAKKAIELGYGEAAGAGVICFEWLQRPENVLAGFVRWSDYRPAEKPTFLQIEHAKTGAKIWHPLEDNKQHKVSKYGTGKVSKWRRGERIMTCLRRSICLRNSYGRPRGGVVTQRSAKPFTPVQFRAWPPSH